MTTPEDQLARTVAAIRPLDRAAVAAAQARQLTLIKPPGALGRLETVGNQLCGIAGCCPPPYPARARALVFAGDHGVVARGISPWAQAVTVQMAVNQATGQAGCSVLAAEVGAEIEVVDVGVAGDTSHCPAIVQATVRPGTADITVADAMTRGEALAALAVGIAAVERAVAAGVDVIVPGEMGIGNTTTSAALVCALTGAAPAEVTGRGGGSGDAMLARKVAAVADAVALHPLDGLDGVDVLAALGGLEIAAMTGAMLASAAHRLPVVLDGIIAAAAALVAVRLAPAVRDYLIAGHLGAEPGIARALAELDLTPLVHLDLRLGEASGALMAVPSVRAAARVLRDMASFEQAGVDSRMRED